MTTQVSNEIVTSRLIDAPQALVFEAWTNPQHVAKWWGPRGFSTTIHEMSVKEGGVWRFMMHGPDGVDYPNRIRFLEVIKPEKLVFIHDADIKDDPDQFQFQNVVTFEAKGSKTLLTMRAVFQSAEIRDKVVREHGAIEGGRQTLERLSEYAITDLKTPFTITRTFDASLDTVWKAHTEAKHLAKWWGPKGFTMLDCSVDLTPGGLFHYGMKAPDGSEMWGKFVYREIVEKKRLVFVVSFSDKNRATARHPMAPTWPLEMLNIVTFSESNGKTTVTLTGGAVNASEEEEKTYDSNHASMRSGFGGTYDQLEVYLRESEKRVA